MANMEVIGFRHLAAIANSANVITTPTVGGRRHRVSGSNWITFDSVACGFTTCDFRLGGEGTRA